ENAAKLPLKAQTGWSSPRTNSRMGQYPRHFVRFGSSYLNLSATFDRAAFEHAASLSPPGAPLTATAPIVASPTLIGTPPMALIVPGIFGGGTGAPGARFAGGPDGRL